MAYQDVGHYPATYRQPNDGAFARAVGAWLKWQLKRIRNPNAFAERWVHSAKRGIPVKRILVGEGSLRRALREYIAHFHGERNHQAKGNVLLLRERFGAGGSPGGRAKCRERLITYVNSRPA